MPKNLSVKYYQDNNERLLKKGCKIYQILSKEEMTENMAVKDTKVHQKVKNQVIEFARQISSHLEL